MSEGEVSSVNFDPATANDKLVQQIHANFDAALAEVEHQRANERQDWLAYSSEVRAEESHASAMAKGSSTRDSRYAAAGEHWRGVKAASNTQKAENATWSATRKDDREAAKDVQSASSGRAR